VDAGLRSYIRATAKFIGCRKSRGRGNGHGEKYARCSKDGEARLEAWNEWVFHLYLHVENEIKAQIEFYPKNKSDK